MIRKRAACVICAVIIISQICLAQNQPSSAQSPLSFSLFGGVNYFKHTIVTGEAPQNVSYVSNPLATIRSEVSVNLWGATFISGSLDRSLSAGDRGGEMMRGTVESVSGLEKFTAGIRTDPFIRHYLGGATAIGRVVRGLLSLRFRHTSELFYTTGTVIDASEYITHSMNVDYPSQTASPSNVLPAGTRYEFKTKYSFNEVSFIVLENAGIGDVKKSRVRFGYATAHFERPTNLSTYTLNGKPLVFYAVYDARQLAVIYEPMDYSAPGLNMEAALSLGVDNKVDHPINFTKAYNPNGTVQQNVSKSISVFELNLWFNKYFESQQNPKLALTVGFFMKGYGFDLSVVKEGSDEDRSEKKIAENDYIYQFYCAFRITM